MERDLQKKSQPNLWLSSVANSYIQPSLESQFLQYTSLTSFSLNSKEILQFLPSPDHVPARQHHPVLHLAELEVDHLVEEECSPCSSSEPSTQN